RRSGRRAAPPVGPRRTSTAAAPGWSRRNHSWLDLASLGHVNKSGPRPARLHRCPSLVEHRLDSCPAHLPSGASGATFRSMVIESDGLVRTPLPTPMLQPAEVHDQQLFDLEMVRVFARSWVWLGDTEDLKEPGDFITGRLGTQPVIVIRQEDGTVRGFLN